MKVPRVLGVAAAVLCSPVWSASAEDATATQDGAGKKFMEWYCAASPDEFRDFAIESKGFRVNNVLVVESVDVLTEAPVITVSASLSNRSDRRIAVSLQYYGGNASETLFTVSSGPAFGWVSAMKTEEMHGQIYVMEGALAEATKHCIRFNAFGLKG